MTVLHGRLTALLALLAVLTFVSGAGFDAPSVLPAAVVLLAAVFLRPADRLSARLEPVWRLAAVLLVARAVVRVATGAGDPVLPMVDVLLLLLCAESLRVRDGSGDARHFALTFALLIAAAAYRPGPLFGILFIAYVACAVVVLMVGNLAREARAWGTSAPEARPAFLARTALLSTFVIAASVTVFLLFPRVPGSFAARASDAVPRAIVGFSDRVSIGAHGTRIEANPEIVLRIEFPDGEPAGRTGLHWRGRTYDRFDGAVWSRTERAAPPPREAATWPGPIIEQVIYARPLRDADVLFGLHPVIDITPLSRIRPRRGSGGDYTYSGVVDPVYRVRSRDGSPSPAALRQAEPDYPPEVISHLQLPPLSARTLALAYSFRQDAPTMYDQVRAVERFLRTEFTYTLELPATRRQATLEYFLFERRAGHCEYFSTAMAMLLRAGGVAARNVNGFLGGEWNEFGQYLTVTQNNAHSWVEVFFPGYGWVTFDPTPPSAAAGIAAGAGVLSTRRLLLDGLEHRWGKWVLDYDLGRQTAFMQGLARPFSSGRERAPDGVVPAWWMVAAAVVILGGAVLASRRRRGPAAWSSATRAYMALRRAYARAGFVPPGELPPLAFVRLVGEAPGAEHARNAVALYLRTRFGGTPLTDAEQTELNDAVGAAQAALARSR